MAAEAEKCEWKALAIGDQLPPEKLWMRLLVLDNAAEFYRRQNNYRDAEKLLRQGLEIAEASPAQNQSHMVDLRRSLASLYHQEGKTAEAETLLRDAVPADVAASANGPHADFSGVAHEQRLASDYKDQGKLEESEAHDKNVISTLEEATPPADPGRMALALDELGDVYEAEGRDADAEEVFLHSLQRHENAAPHRIDLAQTLGFHSGRLLNLYRKEGRLDEMDTILQRDLSIQEAALGPNDKGLGETLTQLARLYIEENNYDEAVLSTGARCKFKRTT